MRKLLVAAVAGLATAASLSGCAAWDSAHNYNAPAPAVREIPNWTRVEDPGNFPSIIRACVKGDGIYIAQDGANGPEVIPHDPACQVTNARAQVSIQMPNMR